ncbi:hypothetical protein NIIDMKKI_46950 [Mycobacterium kansasii]|uniref:Ferric siderophore reductase C-terminal domain-containing protein n=1 Tax=Mycobacterium kansasii TaxID=1768 RepID=A0A7G1IIB5_MYCKA|nr:hypothetical protein NIIDMKKI_46950 [Mycobacterium kansasii]
MYRVVVRDHMEQFAAGLEVKLASGLLCGNIASALVGTSRVLLSLRPDLRMPIVETTTSLLRIGRMAATGVLTGPDLGFKRRSCCLFYRVPGGGTCGDCPLSVASLPPVHRTCGERALSGPLGRAERRLETQKLTTGRGDVEIGTQRPPHVAGFDTVLDRLGRGTTPKPVSTWSTNTDAP